MKRNFVDLKSVLFNISKNFSKIIFHINQKDPETSPYKTIQEAVDAAEPGSVIKVAPGLYSDNLVIK